MASRRFDINQDRYTLAAFVTSIVIATFTMKIGRRGTILIGNVVAIAGAVVQATAYGVPQMIVGRLLNGFAIGAISSSVPTYLNECGSKITDRGPANALSAMFVISGVPIAYWLDYGFVQWHHQASWRIPIILQCVFAILAGLIIWYLPDTPRWYYARGRNDEGDITLTRLYDQPMTPALFRRPGDRSWPLSKSRMKQMKACTGTNSWIWVSATIQKSKSFAD